MSHEEWIAVEPSPEDAVHPFAWRVDVENQNEDDQPIAYVDSQAMAERIEKLPALEAVVKRQAEALRRAEYPRVEVSGNRGPCYVRFGPIAPGEVAHSYQVADGLIVVDVAADGRVLGLESLGEARIVNWAALAESP